MDIETLFKDNHLLVNGTNVNFTHSIKDVKIAGDNAIVLLDIPPDDNTIDNLYSVSSNGKINWRSQNIGDIFITGRLLPYEEISIEGNEILASDFCGRLYYLNVDDGTIIKREIYR